MGPFVSPMTRLPITRRRLLLASGIAALIATGALPSAAGTPVDGVVEVVSGEARHRFTIEIADDAAERSRGLMFRQSMSDDAGMLFIYAGERIASFWMKNTYIPLDMLFIANDGTILQIATDVQPHTLDPVRSDLPVRAVFEINGGQSAARGIKAGDKVVLYR